MPATSPDSSPDDADPSGPARLKPDVLLRHLALFLATGVSMMGTYAMLDEPGPGARASWVHGATFAGSLLLILLAHELGHYFAARLHRVDSTLPFFIPLPVLSPFGTLGAVIRMRGTIPSRRALLDIGASGPLAGLAFAIPMYAWGIKHSPIVPDDPTFGSVGDSLLSRGLDALFAPHIAPGMTQIASPVLYAAWAGFFVTMLNLLPVGQLDGGHIAFALLGKRQNRATVVAHRSLLALFFVTLAGSVYRDVAAGFGAAHLGRHVNASFFWLMWFEVLAILGALTKEPGSAGSSGPARARLDDETLPISTRAISIVLLATLAWFGREHTYPSLWAAWFVGLAALLAMEARGGTLRAHDLFDHPPVGTASLGAVRTVIAVVSLAFFVALFMPIPMSL